MYEYHNKQNAKPEMTNVNCFLILKTIGTLRHKLWTPLVPP